MVRNAKKVKKNIYKKQQQKFLATITIGSNELNKNLTQSLESLWIKRRKAKAEIQL
jgi:hypothetical protein